MRNARAGFLSVTCPTHKEAKNDTGFDWVDNENLKKIENELAKNLDLIKAQGIISHFYELYDVEKKFNNENIDLIFIYISTWNWADQVSQFIRNMNKPVILYAIDDSKAWSIGGLAATHGGLDELNINHKVTYGDIKENDVMDEIVSYAKAAMVKNILRRSIFGSIGGQGMGILTGVIDANQWLKEFGILTGFTDMYTLVVEAETIPEKDVKDYYNVLQNEYKSIPEYNKVFEKSIRIYLAFENIIKKERYDFTGLKCTFDLSDNFCSGCLAQSRLANRGFVSTCLNDSNGALSSYILSLLKKETEPLFTADVNLVNKKENLIKMIDDGAASPKLTLNPKEEVELHMQPKLEAKASGICTKLIAKPGEVTIMRLSRINGKYVMHLTEGTVLAISPNQKESLLKECGYPNWPHALIKIKGDMNRFVKNLRSEYLHMTYGNLKKDLKEVSQIYGMDFIEN